MNTVDDLPDSAVGPALNLLKVLHAFNGRYEIDEREPDIMKDTAQDLERCGLVTLDEEYDPAQARVVVTITSKTRRTPHDQH